jgi:hypothetical protein
MPQTKQEKRKGAIKRLVRYIKRNSNPKTDEETEAQVKRIQHLEYLESIKDRR